MPLEEKDESIESTIASEYKAIMERADESDTLDDTPVVVEAKPARDEEGKFAKKDETTDEPAKVDDKPAAEVKPEAAAAPVTEQPEPVLRADGKPADLNRPPAEWKPAAKAKWAALDPDIRTEILRREVDAFKKFSQSAPEIELGRNIKSLGERYQQVIQLDGGGDISRAVGAFFNTASVLRFGTPQQKRQAIDYLEQTYGIAPKAQPAADGGQQLENPATPQQEFRDPRLDSLLAQWQQQEANARQAADAQATQATQKFLNATNEKGEPLYPYVDNVLDDMTIRVKTMRERNPSISHDEALKKSYDEACWANPETRAILQQSEVVRLEAQRREANLQKVGRARQAAAVNVPVKGSMPAQAPLGTIEDTIRETYRAINGG